VNNYKHIRTKSEALHVGRLFDDRGHRMTPSHARKGAIKYRYYISSALVQGQTEQAGTVNRVPAKEIETLVAKSIRHHLGQPADIEDAVIIRDHVVRVEIRRDRLMIEPANAKGAGAKRKRGIERIEVPWRKTSATRCREMRADVMSPGQCLIFVQQPHIGADVGAIARRRRTESSNGTAA
jgi:site-specific DNA recombinase